MSLKHTSHSLTSPLEIKHVQIKHKKERQPLHTLTAVLRMAGFSTYYGTGCWEPLKLEIDN